MQYVVSVVDSLATDKKDVISITVGAEISQGSSAIEIAQKLTNKVNANKTLDYTIVDNNDGTITFNDNTEDGRLLIQRTSTDFMGEIILIS